MDYKQALGYLDSFINYEKFSNYNYKRAYSLTAIKRLLKLLGNPQDRYPSVIISGTKGKGSTAAMLTSILRASGIKTGLFISPHLVSITERIKIKDKLISQKEFRDTLSLIKKAIDKNRIKGLTFFEVLTAVCFLYFAKKKINIAVLEVGLGGRLDATNCASSCICAITPISYDHMHLLGNSLGKIAKEKSGIIKRGAFVVSAPQEAKVLKVIKEQARRKNAKLFIADKNTSCKNPKVSLIGAHQLINARCAIKIAELLKNKFGFNILEKNIQKGLAQVKFPGRFQIISKNPYVVLDGAQNKASAKALKNTFKEFFKKKKLILILGISSDKDIEAIGRELCPLAESVIFTKANSQRALEPAILAQKLSRFCKNYYVAYDSKDALKFAKNFTTKEGVILVTGSLFLVGEILK